MATTTPDEFLTVSEVGRLLRMSPQSIRRMVQRGDIPGYRLGDVEIRIKREDIDAYLLARPVTGPAEVRDGRRKGGRPGPRPDGRRGGGSAST